MSLGMKKHPVIFWLRKRKLFKKRILGVDLFMVNTIYIFIYLYIQDNVYMYNLYDFEMEWI